jgi:hypothetical protein
MLARQPPTLGRRPWHLGGPASAPLLQHGAQLPLARGLCWHRALSFAPTSRLEANHGPRRLDAPAPGACKGRLKGGGDAAARGGRPTATCSPLEASPIPPPNGDARPRRAHSETEHHGARAGPGALAGRSTAQNCHIARAAPWVARRLHAPTALNASCAAETAHTHGGPYKALNRPPSSTHTRTHCRSPPDCPAPGSAPGPAELSSPCPQRQTWRPQPCRLQGRESRSSCLPFTRSKRGGYGRTNPAISPVPGRRAAPR